MIRFDYPEGISHSPHGECGLKLCYHRIQKSLCCHSPHGECGLKYLTYLQNLVQELSLPAWGVWIEIARCKTRTCGRPCHSPHGECGLKLLLILKLPLPRSHSPHGECGLKSFTYFFFICCHMSLPAWGVWIEILSFNGRMVVFASLPAWGVWIEIQLLHYVQLHGKMSLPAWGVWIEITLITGCPHCHWSLPAWGVWIEIFVRLNLWKVHLVTPRMGSVD